MLPRVLTHYKCRMCGWVCGRNHRSSMLGHTSKHVSQFLMIMDTRSDHVLDLLVPCRCDRSDAELQVSRNATPPFHIHIPKHWLHSDIADCLVRDVCPPVPVPLSFFSALHSGTSPFLLFFFVACSPLVIRRAPVHASPWLVGVHSPHFATPPPKERWMDMLPDACLEDGCLWEFSLDAALPQLHTHRSHRTCASMTCATPPSSACHRAASARLAPFWCTTIVCSSTTPRTAAAAAAAATSRTPTHRKEVPAASCS